MEVMIEDVEKDLSRVIVEQDAFYQIHSDGLLTLKQNPLFSNDTPLRLSLRLKNDVVVADLKFHDAITLDDGKSYDSQPFELNINDVNQLIFCVNRIRQFYSAELHLISDLSKVSDIDQSKTNLDVAFYAKVLDTQNWKALFYEWHFLANIKPEVFQTTMDMLVEVGFNDTKLSLILEKNILLTLEQYSNVLIEYDRHKDDVPDPEDEEERLALES